MSGVLPYDVIVAGVGGQGGLFAAQVLAQAAFAQGLTVRVAETYGVAQRGGPVFSQVRIGYGVAGPLIPRGECPLILGLEPIEALRRAAEYLAPGGAVVLNSRVSAPLETKMGKQPDLDLTTVRRELGRLGAGSVLEVDALALALGAGGPSTLNVVMLGALLSVESFPLTYDAMVSGLEVAAEGRYMQQNLLSLERGRDYGVQQRPNGSDSAHVSV